MLGGNQRPAQALVEIGAGGNFHPELRLNLLPDFLREQVVNVVAAQVGVAVGAQYLEQPFLQLEEGDIEGAAAEVIDGDQRALVLVQPVGERGGGGLVHQPLHLQTGNPSGILGSLALGVVEVGRYGDDRPRHFLAEKLFRPPLQLAQDEGGNFRRG